MNDSWDVGLRQLRQSRRQPARTKADMPSRGEARRYVGAVLEEAWSQPWHRCHGFDPEQVMGLVAGAFAGQRLDA
ncbi:MAG: hypothetical protein H7831_05140 [Magnetococcus sp. WYHC-3]